MTHFRRELDEAPDPAKVQEIYRERCRDALGEALVDADPTVEEVASIEEVERRFQSDDSRLVHGGMKRHGVKIHEDIWIRSVTLETARGPIQIVGRVEIGGPDSSGTLNRIRIEGAGDPALLEAALQGTRLERSSIEQAIQSAGVTPGWDFDAWVDAIIGLTGSS